MIYYDYPGFDIMVEAKAKEKACIKLQQSFLELKKKEMLIND